MFILNDNLKSININQNKSIFIPYLLLNKRLITQQKTYLNIKKSFILLYKK